MGYKLREETELVVFEDTGRSITAHFGLGIESLEWIEVFVHESSPADGEDGPEAWIRIGPDSEVMVMTAGYVSFAWLSRALTDVERLMFEYPIREMIEEKEETARANYIKSTIAYHEKSLAEYKEQLYVLLMNKE